jgi:purine-binding chemotaxis protein CheW
VIGVANWRGHVLPLVDLRPLLGLTVGSLPSSARVVVVSVDDVEVGLVAEAVTGLVAVPGDCPPAPLTLLGDAADLLVGLAESGPGGPVAILATHAVLALGARVGRPAR